MPGIDGWELGRQLAFACPTVPVLYISAYPRADIFHRGAPSESSPFLQKPFPTDVFLETVRGLIMGADPLHKGLPTHQRHLSSGIVLRSCSATLSEGKSGKPHRQALAVTC